MNSRKNPQPPVTRAEKRAAVTQRLKDFPELPDRAIARQLLVSHTFVAKIRGELIVKDQLDCTRNARSEYLQHPYIKEHPELLEASERTLRALKAPGVLDLMQRRGIGARYAQALLRRAVNEEKEKAASVLTANDIILKEDNVFSGLKWLSDCSIDACIIDAPYDGDAIRSGLYKAIGEVSVRVLKPGKPLVIMCGHKFLNRVFQQLDTVERLNYVWQLHYITQAGGGAPYTASSKAMSFAKPVLLYVKGASQWTGRPFSDLIHAAPPDRAAPKYHPHQQDVQGFCELVKRFSEPGDTVLDMCMGSGTTGVSCVKLRRKFVGIDINAEHIETARVRLLEALGDE